MTFIRIRCDNGYPECGTCAHFESGTCEFCEDGDQWEEGDEARLDKQPELLAA